MNTMNNNSQSVILIPNDSGADDEVKKIVAELGYRNVPYSDFDSLNTKLHVVLVLKGEGEFNETDSSFVAKVIDARVPLIVVYPDAQKLDDIHNDFGFTNEVTSLWDKIPVFRDERQGIPVVHITVAWLFKVLTDRSFKVGSDIMPSDYYVIQKNEEENGR